MYTLASGQFNQNRTRIETTKSITGKSFLPHDHWLIFLQMKQFSFIFFPQWVRKIFKQARCASSVPRIPALTTLSRRKTIWGKFWTHNKCEACLDCREALFHDRKKKKPYLYFNLKHEKCMYIQCINFTNADYIIKCSQQIKLIIQNKYFSFMFSLRKQANIRGNSTL